MVPKKLCKLLRGFWLSKKKNKLPKEQLTDIIDEICIEQIGEEYRVKFESDDGGYHVCISFEEECPALAKQIFHGGSFHGWDVILKIVPAGYLAVFDPLNKKEDQL